MWISSITSGVKMRLCPSRLLLRADFFTGCAFGAIFSFAMSVILRMKFLENDLLFGGLQVVIIPQLLACHDLGHLHRAVRRLHSIELELAVEPLRLEGGHLAFDGIDADLRIAITPTVTATFASTYMHKYEVENLDGTFTDVVNTRTFITNGYGGVIPRWHHYATIEWKSGLWDIVVTQNYQARYRDVASTVSEESRQVGAYLTHDLQLSYMVLPSLKLTAGAKNIFNRDPPYTNAGGQDFFQAGYDPGYADPRGRFIYGTVAYSLKWH